MTALHNLRKKMRSSACSATLNRSAPLDNPSRRQRRTSVRLCSRVHPKLVYVQQLMKTIVCSLVVVLSSSFLLASAGDLRQAEQHIFQLANQARKDAGVEPLQWNEEAAEAARVHAKLMADKQALSHQFSGELALRERMGET